jgi:hypothetical protein
MFPDPKYKPTTPSIERRYLPIPYAVGFDFGFPKSMPHRGQSIMFAATMPETRIYEDDGLVFSQNNIRSTKIVCRIG